MDWSDVLLAAVPLFVVVDPLASIGLYLGLTARHDRRARDRIALRASLFAATMLVLFTFVGKSSLRFMGIELYSLQVAGGILLTLIGLNMLREGEEVPRRELAEGELEVATGGRHQTGHHDPSLVPLGLPMLAGPGAISLVIVQGTEYQTMTIAASVLLVMVASLLILLVAGRASHVIGENARRVVTRIAGLLTVAFAVQYVLDGLDGWRGA